MYRTRQRGIPPTRALPDSFQPGYQQPTGSQAQARSSEGSGLSRVVTVVVEVCRLVHDCLLKWAVGAAGGAMAVVVRLVSGRW